MKSIIRYTMITAFRDLLFLGLFGLVILAVIISSFLGGTAVSEQDEMTMSYMAGSMRTIMMIGLTLFICFHVKRLFDNKEIEVVLSRNISRTQFITSYWLSFTLLSTTLALAAIFVLLILNQTNKIGLLYFGISLILEGSILVAFALLSSLILRSAVASTLSVFCFYFMSRMMGFVTASFKTLVLVPDSWNGIWMFGSEWFLKMVSIMVPRLDLSAKSSWLIYGIEKQTDYWVFPLQALIYIPLMILVAIYDFNRKEF